MQPPMLPLHADTVEAAGADTGDDVEHHHRTHVATTATTDADAGVGTRPPYSHATPHAANRTDVDDADTDTHDGGIGC